jgi:hypothetical protein
MNTHPQHTAGDDLAREPGSLLRLKYPARVEKGREVGGGFASPAGAVFGAFRFKLKCSGTPALVLVGDGFGWDHVSMSLAVNRCPTWAEMCELKELFFEPDAWVLQFHPPVSENINNHEYCLHLWHPQRDEIPTPPPITVGLK